jgi:methionyl-tRNA synthetase
VSRTFYLTTPIYYVNDAPHLGHAYTTILADTMTRYHRLLGDEAFFLTGTDEHGEKVAQSAARAGVSPQAMADQNSAVFRRAWDALGLRYGDYIRTTEPRHERVVQTVLQKLWDAGEIYLGKYGGHYCFGCERFYTEKEIVDGKCPDHLTALTWIEEENYFFRMKKYQEWLIGTLEARPELVRPQRYRNEVLAFLRDPLLDLSISRPRTRVEWGVPLPFDDRFVTYVWFDALLNYVSALGGPGDSRFEKFWPACHHMIAKDILKPHAIYWPCMLAAMAEADGKPREAHLYQHLNVHGYWTVEGQKMSKSLGNVFPAVAPAEKYGLDAYRYFVLREMVFGLDADFSEAALVGRLNADLANDLGNLVARATTLIVNLGHLTAGVPINLLTPHAPIAAAFAEALALVQAAMSEFAFHKALAAIWEFIGALNRYIDSEAPWTLVKDPELLAQDPGSPRDAMKLARLGRVVCTLAESLRCLGIVLEPFLPDAATKIRAAVGYADEPMLTKAVIGSTGVFPVAYKLSGLFPRVEQKKAPAGESRSAVAAADTVKATALTIAEFGKVELRVAQVVAAEAVPKSKKLLKLTVSLGVEQRTIVAGIAQHYAPADLIGKKVVVVANLEPATLMGVPSQGMVLAGSTDGDGALAVVTLDRDLPPGAKVR